MEYLNHKLLSKIAVRTKPVRIRLVCNECGRKFSVSPNAADPQCKCGSVDWECAE
jgi:hypothetical protein